MDRTDTPPEGWVEPTPPRSPAPFPVFRAPDFRGLCTLDGYGNVGEKLVQIAVIHGLRWTDTGWLCVTTYAPDAEESSDTDFYGPLRVKEEIDAELDAQAHYGASNREAAASGDTVQPAVDGEDITCTVACVRNVSGTHLAAPNGSLVVLSWSGPWQAAFATIVSSTDISAILSGADAEMSRRRALR